MPGCDERVGKGAVVWPCVGEANHDGPHWANEHAPSVVQRQRWDAGQRHGVADKGHEQLPLFAPPVTSEPEAERKQTPREILEEFQGTPQTFWERNGIGDEYPAPKQEAAPAKPESSPLAMDSAAVEAALESVASLLQATKAALQAGNISGAKGLVQVARSTLGALQSAPWDEATVTQS